MKKLVSLFLALVLLASVVTIPALADEKPVITMLIGQDNTPAEDNSVLKAIGEKFGCTFQATVTSDYNAKLNTLIASDSLPDIFSVKEPETLTQMAEAGRLWNMKDALPTYGADIQAYYGDSITDLVVNDADHIYGLASEAGLYLKNLNIRKDWLEKVGLDVPTNADELYNVLHAFTYDDPDGNGVDDTRGIAMHMANADMWQHILNLFDITIPSFTDAAVVLEDGTVTTVLKHPRFLEAIEYLRKLYAEGLMDPDFATLTQMQCFEELWNGKIGMLDFQSVGTTNNWYPARYTFDVPENPGDLFAFATLNGTAAVYPSRTTADVVINAKSENPELALEIVNYLYYTPEGQDLLYMGVEGLHYEWLDKEAGKYQRLGIYTDDVVHRADGAFVYAWSGGYTKTNSETRLMNKTTQDAQANEWLTAKDRPVFNKVLETRSEYGADLDGIVAECFAQLIVTEGDVEAEWAEYVQRWEDEGGAEYEAEATAAWAEQNK